MIKMVPGLHKLAVKRLLASLYMAELLLALAFTMCKPTPTCHGYQNHCSQSWQLEIWQYIRLCKPASLKILDYSILSSIYDAYHHSNPTWTATSTMVLWCLPSLHCNLKSTPIDSINNHNTSIDIISASLGRVVCVQVLDVLSVLKTLTLRPGAQNGILTLVKTNNPRLQERNEVKTRKMLDMDDLHKWWWLKALSQG